MVGCVWARGGNPYLNHIISSLLSNILYLIIVGMYSVTFVFMWSRTIVKTTPISLSDLMATAIQSSLKHLSASGLQSSIPSLYVSRSSEAVDAESVVEEDVPVIDFSLLQGTQEERSQAVRDLGRACEEWGFFMVVNHGVAEELRSMMLAALDEFFDLSDEEKLKYTGNNVLDPIRCGTSFNTAVEEVRYWRDFLKVIVHPEFNSPDNPPGFRDILQEYSTCTRNMARELLKGISESLGLAKSSMDDALDLNSSFELFTANLYPPCPQPELAFGLPPHSDFCLLTVLLQNGVDGLQVMHNGRWVQVKPLPNSFLINTGDQAEVVTNGKYKSVLHRAILNNKISRMSVVTLIGPSMETIVAPAPELASREDNQARFLAMKYKDFFECHQQNKLKDKSVLDLLRLPVE